MEERTSVDDNLLAALCYWASCLLAIPPLILFIMKKDESPFIRFHSLQALGLMLVSIVVSIILSVGLMAIAMVPVVGPIIYGLASLVLLLLNCVFMVYVIFVGIKAYNGEEYAIPVLGDFVNEKFMN